MTAEMRRHVPAEARRHDVGKKLERLLHEGPVDRFLMGRAEQMVSAAKVGEYLRSKIVFSDRLAGKVSRGVEVLSVGAGKGHEIDEMDSILPGSKITAVDPHDHMSRPVEKRLRETSHEATYLHEGARGEDLSEIEDRSQDGVTLFFTLHHMTPESSARTLEEVKRVLKDDGHVFVAEDIPSTDEEQARAKRRDRLMNTEIAERSPHTYRDLAGWQNMFEQYGFEVVEVHGETLGKSSGDDDIGEHAFFVLRKAEHTSAKEETTEEDIPTES